MGALDGILPGQFFRHYKDGAYYYVVCVSRSAEWAEDPIVVYRKVGISPTGEAWHHTAENFLRVMPDGRQRFTPCSFEEVARNLRIIDEGLYEEINAWGVRTFGPRKS